MGEGLAEDERVPRVLLDSAREVLGQLRERVLNRTVDLGLLLDVQSLFILGLSDASLYAFALRFDDLVEESYGIFREGYVLLKHNGLLVSDPELDLQLGMLKNLDVKRGFSLDRRLSMLGSPREIQVWVNRIIKLRNALYGVFPRDPLRELGYGMSKEDRKFPMLLKAVTRVYEMSPPTVEALAKLLYLEMELGLDPSKLPCRNGRCEEILSLGSVEGFEVVNSGDVELYYRFKEGKHLDSPWGRITMGEPVEIVIFSKEKKRGFRCVRS
ncbi:hypothetical protein A3L09_05900 [Thermococcus profundus]|uniref:Uncharacterized protein n=1 Tax=Thermococcus profundus TaxID=49899 RepID=A0A2Z2MK77_THEPR|nr:hypothetical protein [Thermococcus profundus]ASJ02821.1 hypothetical protein A3L09_05900 [Thermococcus profundus]